ncbi:TPA: AAA family ATPase [Escherichia coli]|uniref:AAA family ATPase n=1 Tax=Escherichia TaxID=561 RepID=UPI00039176BF|nr:MULTISPECIES: AAA family ATPase [Escherichia]EEZ9698167.1 AAA family ATPase [Escherichia coli O1]EEV5712272.1 DNA repair protein [Escherichia coli]EEW2292019.1 DNA repair protein [Escherichia coli]EEW8190252.1 AAA family ATPase [Escherichia coli]EFC1592743.1 DNA repair protein [Escherichia coli]
MKIKKVEIEAFRAYKSRSDGTFDFTNDGDVAANFVAIYAPNGFGKSSFYDAVEWAITNHMARLGGEYNKANYENAAKITKDDNVGQEILRNKYVDKNIRTKVVVSTTRPLPFERKLPKVRSNGRDLRFGDNSQRENDFFRQVILSQDEIDRFLREAKPQERYTKFMESFGGDIEIARKELSVLINDNKIELNNINKKRESILEQLKQPIDSSIFQKFNSIAVELNKLGENIQLPDESFSSQDEYALNVSLISRRHELDSSRLTNNRTVEALEDRLLKISETELHVRSLAEQNLHLAKLVKGVADADRYQSLLDSYEKCAEDQKTTHMHMTRIIEVIDCLDDFLKIESHLLELSTSQKIISEERTKICAQLAGFETTINQLNKELKAVDDRVAILRKTVDNAGQVYLELANNRARVSNLTQQISKKEVSIKIDKSRLGELNRELTRLSELNINATSLSNGNLGTLLLEPTKVEQLTRCYAEFDVIESQIQAVHVTQKALSEQMELHERLIAIGIDYLSVRPSSICPLCTAPHPSADGLLDKIKGRNLLSELSEENSKQLLFFSTRQKEILQSIQDITQCAIDSKAQLIINLNKELSETDERLTLAGRDIYSIEAELKTLEKRTTELESLVWALSHDELVSRIEKEIGELSIKSSKLLEGKALITPQVEMLNESLKEKDSAQQKIASELEGIFSGNIYITVYKYLNENAISSSSLKSHTEKRKLEIEAEIIKCKTTIEFLTEQCAVLQQKMLSDGMWVDFVQLKLQKESLEISVARSQSVINTFYESLSNLIIIRPEYSLEKVKELIAAKVQDCHLRTKEFDRLSNNINLLIELMSSFKPYIKHTALQKDLMAEEMLIKQRERVDTTLTAERDAIVDSLKLLINNFFYEDLINSIYKKIDPHPAFKKVEFKADFDSDKPGLNIVVSDEVGEQISPILYFSAAQTNILSLSVFLASALHAKDDEGNPINVVMIDDPIQSMDSINILSTIDLLRSICVQFDKQIIISTHDENFFALLQRKIPAQIFGSKFLQLEKFGVVVPVQPFVN